MNVILSLKRSKAFTLIEVTMAIGIISFSLLALVGLLPRGLLMVKNTNERAAAAGAFSQLTDAVRNGSPDTNGIYRATAYTNLSWIIGSPNRVDYSPLLKLNGSVAQPSEQPRLVARVELNPPRQQIGVGSARVSIAWPASATWDASINNWKNAEGFITQGIMFVPK